jgi:hypothetical protein
MVASLASAGADYTLSLLAGIDRSGFMRFIMGAR